MFQRFYLYFAGILIGFFVGFFAGLIKAKNDCP